MGVRYVKDFEFPSAAGYSKSTPSKVTGQMYAKGGHVKKYADGGGVDSAGMAQMAGDANALTDAQNVMAPRAPVLTPQQKRQMLLAQAAKRKAMIQQQAAQDARMNDVPPGANYDQGQMDRAERGYKKGGKVAKVMHEFGEGKLHSGSKKGPKVTNPKQAVAIALSEAGKTKKAKGGMAHEDVAADKSLIKSMVKPGALKKADGGPIPPQMRSPLQDMARARSVPVAPRAPMIPQQAAPAGGGPKIGVGVSRPGKPNVGAIRAAMARKASQVMPENAPSMMKKGGKVGC